MDGTLGGKGDILALMGCGIAVLKSFSDPGQVA
jgi:hypothetical protein